MNFEWWQQHTPPTHTSEANLRQLGDQATLLGLKTAEAWGIT